MITFYPDSPWEVGQLVIFREGKRVVDVKVVETVEHSGNETQYSFVDPKVWELRQQGVRPFIELEGTH
jgi:hypothetical protein